MSGDLGKNGSVMPPVANFFTRLLAFGGVITAVSFLTTAFSQSQYPHFRDVARPAGLTVPHISGDKRYILESMSGGVGMFDCDNDGKLDLVVVNGSTVERFLKGGDPLVTLYHQDSDLHFTDITQQAGLTRKGWGMGVAVADYDNDGLLDLFVTGYDGTALYHNLGNCKFEDVTEKAGLKVDGFTTGAAWADYDRDGYVDLFVARYVHVDIHHLPEPGSDPQNCMYKGIVVQCGPWGMEGESDFLFHNRGDGTFEEVSKKTGVNDPAKRYGMSAVWSDYDNDGWPDLYVANDSGPNYLYHNKHDGTFEEVGLLAGVALSGEGRELGSMGVDFGDFDHDGLLDITVTNFADQENDLYRNEGPAKGFTDLAWSSKMGQAVFPYVKWGTGFVDFDNDGWPDIFVASGHIYPQMDQIAEKSGGYRQPMFLFRNKGDRTFENITASAGLGAFPLASRRGAAFGDVRNDGSMAILVLNVGETPSLLVQDVPSPRHRVLFRLVGTKSNRAAIGARVTITAGGMTQFNEVRSGGSYLSQNDLRLHFGLGEAKVMDPVVIRWPDGKTETLHNLAADAIYTVTEGRGVSGAQKLEAPVVPVEGSPAKFGGEDER
jgi:enediyne biosynthesis protein E4